MTKRLAIIGGDGRGGQIAACVEDNRHAFGDLEFEIAGFVNDFERGGTILGYPVLGGSGDLQPLLDAGYYFVNSVHLVGRNHETAAFVEKLSLPEDRLAAIVSRRAFVARSAIIRPGACVMAGAHVNHLARLDVGALLMANTTVGHHAYLGPFTLVTSGAIVGAHAEVGRGASMGLGSILIERRRIGERALAGAAALVTTDIPAGEIWVGAPARFLRNVPRHGSPDDGSVRGGTLAP
jgi:UDP-3-O-[3-hydroxymyristoyl] glucosamine N-acyltransferase